MGYNVELAHRFIKMHFSYLLVAAGVEFEDTRFSPETFQKLKESKSDSQFIAITA